MTHSCDVINLSETNNQRRFLSFTENSVIFNDINQESHVLSLNDRYFKPEVVFVNESEIVTFDVRVNQEISDKTALNRTET